MIEVLQRVVSRRRQREAQAVSKFDALVSKLASGETVDDETIDVVLESSGRSIEALRAAVELRGLGAFVALVDEAETEQRAASAANEQSRIAFEAEYQAAAKRYRECRDRARLLDALLCTQVSQFARLRDLIAAIGNDYRRLTPERRHRVSDIRDDIQRRRVEIAKLVEGES